MQPGGRHPGQAIPRHDDAPHASNILRLAPINPANATPFSVWCAVDLIAEFQLIRIDSVSGIPVLGARPEVSITS